MFLLVNQATSPQPDGPSTGGSLKSLRDKFIPQDKDKDKDKETPEVSGLKTAGPEGEITAGPYSNILLHIGCLMRYLLHCMLLLMLGFSVS